MRRSHCAPVVSRAREGKSGKGQKGAKVSVCIMVEKKMEEKKMKTGRGLSKLFT